MVNRSIKALIRAFNTECEAAINKVTHSNFERSEKRIRTSFDQLNKFYETMHLKMNRGYLNLKIDELHLAHEYALKKQEEKEALREQRAREREDKKLQQEIKEQKKPLIKKLNTSKIWLMI